MLAPVLDSRAYEAVWSQAQQVTVHTTMGANNPDENVGVDVKALHDDQYVYFQMQWDDPEASYKRFPLQKTTDGWRVLQTAKDNSDETVYYEDKISLYITDEVRGGCADTCHIGVGPHAEKGEKHGLHYTDGWTADVWHWKSVRTSSRASRLLVMTTASYPRLSSTC